MDEVNDLLEVSTWAIRSLDEQGYLCATKRPNRQIVIALTQIFIWFGYSCICIVAFTDRGVGMDVIKV